VCSSDLLGQEVTPKLIDEIKPDVVIVATGASQLVPKNIPGADKGTVVTAWDVLGGHEAGTARKAVIIGGNLTGCETADFLAHPNDNLMAAPTEVTILEMRDALALDSMAEPRHLLLDRLREKRVQIQLRAEVKEILDDGVVFVRDGQEESVHGAEYVILAMGAIPVDHLSTEIKGRVAETYVIGDASEPRRTLEAITEAAEIARKI
jgi:pyruvate/2-oxoglutarate dehydrogenase complex dihydrolipoamide dehydrogenase (E3) component